MLQDDINFIEIQGQLLEILAIFLGSDKLKQNLSEVAIISSALSLWSAIVV